MQILLHFCWFLLVVPSLAVFNNDQEDLLLNRPVGHYGIPNQIQEGILRPPKDKVAQKGFHHYNGLDGNTFTAENIPNTLRQHPTDSSFNTPQSHPDFQTSVEAPALNERFSELSQKDNIQSHPDFQTSIEVRAQPTYLEDNTQSHPDFQASVETRAVGEHFSELRQKDNTHSHQDFQTSEEARAVGGYFPELKQKGGYSEPRVVNLKSDNEGHKGNGLQASYQHKELVAPPSGNAGQGKQALKNTSPALDKQPPDPSSGNYLENRAEISTSYQPYQSVGPFLHNPYKGTFPQNTGKRPIQGSHDLYQTEFHGDHLRQNISTAAINNQQGSYPQKGPNLQTVLSAENIYTHPSQYQKPQNLNLQSSPDNHQYGRPYTNTSEYNPPSQKYLPPINTQPIEAAWSHQPFGVPKPPQHYLPPPNNSSTFPQYQNSYQQEGISHNQHFNKSVTSDLKSPSNKYLPATTTVRPHKTLSSTKPNYFTNQHWNPIKTHNKLPSTTTNPLNKPTSEKLPQGYRYNTPSMKQPSHSQNFNAVMYNELGMGQNTSHYYFVPHPSSWGKTEVETQQGYVYGRPVQGLNETSDSVTHLIPVPTMPSSYIYYKPTQNLEDADQNVTKIQEHRQQTSGNSRPSFDLSNNQQVVVDNSGASIEYAINQHTRPFGDNSISQQAGYNYAGTHNNRPSSVNPFNQQAGVNQSPSSTGYTFNDLSRPSSEYPSNQQAGVDKSRPINHQSRPTSNYPSNQGIEVDKARPLTDYPTNHHTGSSSKYPSNQQAGENKPPPSTDYAINDQSRPSSVHPSNQQAGENKSPPSSAYPINDPSRPSSVYPSNQQAGENKSPSSTEYAINDHSRPSSVYPSNQGENKSPPSNDYPINHHTRPSSVYPSSQQLEVNKTPSSSAYPINDHSRPSSVYPSNHQAEVNKLPPSDYAINHHTRPSSVYPSSQQSEVNKSPSSAAYPNNDHSRPSSVYPSNQQTEVDKSRPINHQSRPLSVYPSNQLTEVDKSRPIDHHPSSVYPSNQQTEVDKFRPLTNYPLNQHILNGNLQSSLLYPANQQDANDRLRPLNDYSTNNQSPEPPAQYPANKKYPSRGESQQESYGNSRPLTDYIGNHEHRFQVGAWIQSSNKSQNITTDQSLLNSNINLRPLSLNYEDHKNPHFKPQPPKEYIPANLPQSSPSGIETPISPLGGQPQYSVSESNGNFRPSLGIYTDDQTSAKPSFITPNKPSSENSVTRPLAQNSFGQQLVTPQQTLSIPMYHHPGALEGLGSTDSSGVFDRNRIPNISSLNQIPNNSQKDHGEPSSSQYAPSQNVGLSQNVLSAKRNPFLNNSPVSQSAFSQGSSPAPESISWNQGNQNSPSLLSNNGGYPLKQPLPVRPLLGGVSSSDKGQLSPQGLAHNHLSSAHTFAQLSNLQPAATSSKIVFPNNQEDITAPQILSTPKPIPTSLASSQFGIRPEIQRDSTYPQNNFPNRLNSKYPLFDQRERQGQRQIKEGQPLVGSLIEKEQSPSVPQALQTFLAKTTPAPQIPNTSPISNFFGTTASVPVGPSSTEDYLKHNKSQHKPMIFVDTKYQQISAQRFQPPPYYTIIPRGLPTTPPLVIKNEPLPRPTISGNDGNPLVFLRTSVDNDTPNIPSSLAKPIVFVDSSLVPQEPIHQPHLVYGSPPVAITPSGVVQPPYYKKK